MLEISSSPVRAVIVTQAVMSVPALVMKNRQGAEGVVCCHRDRDGRIDPGELLDRDGVRDGVGSRAAVLLGNGHSHQPELRHSSHEVVREAALAIELLRDGRDSFLREVAHGRADELVLLVEVEVQVLRRWASSTIRRTP